MRNKLMASRFQRLMKQIMIMNDKKSMPTFSDGYVPTWENDLWI